MIVAAILLAASGTWISDSYSSAAGTRAFQIYVPEGYTSGERRPLLVGIHGCTETAAEFAGLTRIAQLADAQRLLVLLPSQSSSANASLCWNWFLPANQKREQGEPSLIRGMIERVRASYDVDPSRIYVYGVSSGGYTAATMLSCYSDVFAAGMVASGGMYEAAGDVFSGALAALYGSLRDPKVVGEDAYRCSGSIHPRIVPVLVFHGSDDSIVAPLSGRQVVDQFVQLNDLGDDGIANGSVPAAPLAIHEESVAGGLSYTWREYGTMIRYYVVNGMGHAWSGGDPRYQYAEPRGPDETAILWQFLQKWRRDEAKVRRRAVR